MKTCGRRLQDLMLENNQKNSTRNISNFPSICSKLSIKFAFV